MPELSVRGGIGIFSGGSPDVYVSNSFSNTGFLTNAIDVRQLNGGGYTVPGIPSTQVPTTGAAILTGVVSTAYTTQVSRREAMYEMEIRAVLADGVVTKEEEAHLRAVQHKYGMSDEQVESIAAQVRAEKKPSH